MHEVKKADKILRSYDSRLFCKWNGECLEIWEHGSQGIDYIVKIIEENGYFRPLDYKDIEEINMRNMSNMAEDVIEEVDGLNRDHKYYHNNKFRKDIRRISTDNFNDIFHNPVITGNITVNP